MNPDKRKTRVTMLCPCCGGEVTNTRYGLDLITASPLRAATWYVCDACAAELSGSDDAARAAAETRFIKYLEENGYAPAA
ncbi:MAG: hypothetical protein AB1482_11640 [Pseudomonadota bacterium]